MFETARNLTRRKLRTALTVLGIAGGALALTVMGAMSEKINLIVNGALAYYKTRVVVQAKSVVPGQVYGPPLPISIVDSLLGFPCVAAASPTVNLLYSDDEKGSGLGLLLPFLIAGVESRFFDLEHARFPISLSSGRVFATEENSVAVVGIDIARAKKVEVGDSLKVRGREFRIIGVMAQSLTMRDRIVFLPLREAQRLLKAVLPPMLFPDPYTLATGIEVYPWGECDPDMLANNINAHFEGIKAPQPSEIERTFRQNLVIFNIILVSNAIIAILVGGLAILNTMLMAVAERTKEIGIKKALGAGNGDIALEILKEAALIGSTGGVLGVLAGVAVALLLNINTASEGIAIFAVTPRLVLFVFLFAVLLSLAAGLYPALSAVRKRPLECLRAE